MSDKCKCESDCACKQVIIKTRTYIEKVIISAKGKDLVVCMKKLEDYCREKGYEREGGVLADYTTDDGYVALDIYAKRCVNPEDM